MPPPVAAEVAVPAVWIVNVLLVKTVTSNSKLSCGAVIPPTAAAPVKVTKSPVSAPCPASVTKT